MGQRTASYFNDCTISSLCVAQNITGFPWRQIDGQTDGSAAATSSGNSRCNLIMNYEPRIMNVSRKTDHLRFLKKFEAFVL